MTNTEIARMAELSKLYIESLQGYDGHSMYPGLPRHLAQEYDSLKSKHAAHIAYRASGTGVNEGIIAALKSRDDAEVEQVSELYTYKEDVTENRVMFFFDGKPSEEVRSILKSQAFKWSPNRGAWVRQLTNAGIYAAERVKLQLKEQTK